MSIETVDRYLDVGDLKRAEILIARLLRASAQDSEDQAQVLLRRSRVRLLSEKPDEALNDLQACLTMQPWLADQPQVMELQADISFARFELAPVGFADRANADRALACYDLLIRQYPEYANLGWLLYQKGRVLISADQTEEAVTAFRQALEKPSHIVALPALCYERLGFVELFDYRNPVSALAYFTQAAQLYPSGENAGWLVQLHILRSRALREQRRYTEALVVARQAHAIIDMSAPDYHRTLAEAYLAIGEALAHIPGRDEDAIEYLVQFLLISRRPLGVDVTWSQVYETIAGLSFRLERYEQALASYLHTLAFNPYHPLAATLFYQIARCYYRIGSYKKVVETIDQMQHLALADNAPIRDHRVYNVLGNAWFSLRKYQQAAEAYEQALALSPGGEYEVQIQTYLRLSQKLSVG
ncbi:MAG TPA: tetratricopeptide repeat protein [Aggregatilineaceae bacterium]|nr:tetratricopeptide repeat protein [Aggregatilineaceae bacterium]